MIDEQVVGRHNKASFGISKICVMKGKLFPGCFSNGW